MTCFALELSLVLLKKDEEIAEEQKMLPKEEALKLMLNWHLKKKILIIFYRR
jgi:hypothetical protein